MPVVVSDTSPIRAFRHLGLVDLLHDLFDRVLVPPAVAAELAKPPPRFPAIDLTNFGFVEVRAPQDRKIVTALMSHLGPGESEAIALAIECNADVLIDESAGRQEAQRHGLSVVGVAGVLLLAKKNGAIALVLPLLDRLKSELNFFVSDDFRKQVAQLAGE